MIHNSFYLYPNKVEVFTDSLDPAVSERYRKVYNRNLKLYRGVDNKIDIIVKNCDQKPISVENFHLVFNLVTRDTQRLVIKKDLVLVPDGDTAKEKGRANVILTREEVLDLESGYYQYSVLIEEREYDDDGKYIVLSSKPTYIDTQFGVYAILEIYGDVAGEPGDSFTIDKFQYTNPFDDIPKFYISSIVDAHPYTATPYSLHTFQFYFSNYEGNVTIEASLDEQGATPHNWTEVHQLLPSDNNEYVNIVGKYNWFRIKHIPTENNQGSLDKVLYR